MVEVLGELSGLARFVEEEGIEKVVQWFKDVCKKLGGSVKKERYYEEDIENYVCYLPEKRWLDIMHSREFGEESRIFLRHEDEEGEWEQETVGVPLGVRVNIKGADLTYSEMSSDEIGGRKSSFGLLTKKTDVISMRVLRKENWSEITLSLD